MQFDEKWSFLGKKEKHCDSNDPKDAQQGDNWDHGERLEPKPTGKPGRPKASYYKPAATLNYATVHKTPKKGRVVKIDFRAIFRTVAAVMEALKLSKVSNKINMYTYNFCWPARTLRQRDPDDRWLPRTPAMAAGLTDHVWSLREWLTFPAVQRE